MFLITRVKCVKCARYVNVSNNVLLFVHIIGLYRYNIFDFILIPIY